MRTGSLIAAVLVLVITLCAAAGMVSTGVVGQVVNALHSEVR